MPIIISSILSILSNVVGGISEAQKEKIALELQQNQNITELLKAQANIDANEALNPNLYISGARPTIMWVCAIAFAWQYLVLPISCWVAVLAHKPEMVSQLQSLHLDFSTMNSILMGMLGLAGYRTFEKYNNVQNNH